MKDHFEMMARYNQWANVKLLEAASRLSEEQYDQDCEVFFKSMNGTLNHILMADEIWLCRLQGISSSPKNLDPIPYPTFSALQSSRNLVDLELINFVCELDEESLADEISYTLVTSPVSVTQSLSAALAHLFNHQTHHRGQAHAILTRITGDAPPLDLLFFQRETHFQ